MHRLGNSNSPSAAQKWLVSRKTFQRLIINIKFDFSILMMLALTFSYHCVNNSSVLVTFLLIQTVWTPPLDALHCDDSKLTKCGISIHTGDRRSILSSPQSLLKQWFVYQLKPKYINSEEKGKRKIDSPLRLCEFVLQPGIHSPHLQEPALGIHSAKRSIKFDAQN